MSNPSVKNIAAAKPMVGGGVYYVAGTTPLPADASTPLSAEILAGALGYVSDQGLRPTRSSNVEKKKAWGGDIVAALLADEERSFAFTLLEVFSAKVNEFVYGAGNVVVTAATTTTGTKVSVQDKGGKPDQGVLVFDMKHGAKRRRVVVPIGDPTVTGEGPYVDNDLYSYEVEVSALKDGNGVRVYDYLENDDRAAA